MVPALVSFIQLRKHALMGSSHMCRDTPIVLHSRGGGYVSSKPSLNSQRYCHMQFSFNVPYVRNAFAACLWGTLLLAFLRASQSVAYDPFERISVSSPVYAHATSSVSHYDSKTTVLLEEFSDFIHQRAIRISESDLANRKMLERSFQLAAFQQFDSHRTGLLYNVSVPGMPSGSVRAIRLRSGSFRRYGVNINEFTIPRGCIVDPIPERILLVYAQFANRSLFQSVPAGFALASPVFSVLVYDAGNLNSSQMPQQLSVSTTASLISIRFLPSSSFMCAQFDSNTTAVNITDSAEGVCQVDHLGTFAFVNSVITPSPSPNEGQPSVLPTHKKHSNTWKIVVGSVIGGLALLAIISLLAVGIGKRRKDARLSRMEYQAEQGETLQMATVRNSRVPAAANTRTQATLVNDYTV